MMPLPVQCQQMPTLNDSCSSQDCLHSLGRPLLCVRQQTCVARLLQVLPTGAIAQAREISVTAFTQSCHVMQAALEDLVKAQSNKLFPFVKLLLAENSLLQSSAAATEPNGVKVCCLVLLSLLIGRGPPQRALRFSGQAPCKLTAAQIWSP